jgi:hypothetical protein
MRSSRHGTGAKQREHDVARPRPGRSATHPRHGSTPATRATTRRHGRRLLAPRPAASGDHNPVNDGTNQRTPSIDTQRIPIGGRADLERGAKAA